MTIARVGNFALRHRTYVDDVVLTTYNIEIVKYVESGSCYTIASFTPIGEIVSCGSRLLDVMCEDPENVDQIHRLAEIAALIYKTTEVEI